MSLARIQEISIKVRGGEKGKGKLDGVYHRWSRMDGKLPMENKKDKRGKSGGKEKRKGS
jgi:hypothetical protein